MAQRTADAAIREAKEEAARLVAEARDSTSRQIAEADALAKQLVADAETRAAAIVAEAERQATEHRESTDRRLRSEIEALEGTREDLRSDANVIDRHVEEQRQQLRSALAELQRLIDDPQGLKLSPPPPKRQIDVPPFEPAEPIGPAPTASSVDTSATAGANGASGAGGEGETRAETDPSAPGASSDSQPSPPAGEPPASGPSGVEVSLDHPPPPVVLDDRATATDPVVDLTGRPEAEPARPDAPRPDEAVKGGDREVADRSSPDGSDVADVSPGSAGGELAPSEGDDHVTTEPATGSDDPDATQAVPTLVGDADEDAFLAELRKAMTDDEPLGPRDEANVPVRSTIDPLAGESHRSRSRFGRRR